MIKEKYTEFFNLGNIPLVNNLNDTFESSLYCEKYSLSIGISDTGFVRLVDVVDSSLLFDKYLYLSGTSKPFIEHCEGMIDFLKKYITFQRNDLIVDIGGNDGTLLKTIKNQIHQEVRLVNIEPSNVVNFTKDNEFEIINSYFDEHSVTKVGSKSRVIFSTNVFQHLLDIESFIKNVKDLLIEDGIWCLEFPYWHESMKTLQFDQIYHEHIWYYNLIPLSNLLKCYNLRVFSVSPQNIHGGSLRLLICHQNSKYITENSVNEYIVNESNITKDFYINWQSSINNHVEECREEIIKFSKSGKIVAFGAAAKGCVFLNYLGIDYRNIEYIIDDTIIKQGKYMPGTGLQIYSRDKLKKDNPDFILILAHNFKDYIIESLRNYGYKNKFIVCLPKFEVV